MIQENRGTILQQGAVMRINNARVEQVFTSTRTTGYLLISYLAPRPNGRTTTEQLRLNVNRNTVILNSSGSITCLCDIQKGMWINAVFSPAMTRSIPPQTNAFLIVVQNQNPSSLSVTTDRVARVDPRNRFLYTGSPNNINQQTRFVIGNSTPVVGRNGMPIGLQALRPGQLVRVTHANFQTASIPPQTTAFHVQLL